MKKIKLKSVLTGMFILLGGIHYTGSNSVGSAGDPYSTFELPIYQGGYNIIKKFNPDGRPKTINYRVQLKPPATEIIEFYDSFFYSAGWISSFETCQRHWDDSAADRSIDAVPGKQMYAAWEHPDLDLKAVLWLKRNPAEKQKQNVVKVEFRLQQK